MRQAKPASPWKLAFKQLLKNKFAVTGAIVVILMFIICFLGPVVSPYSLETMNIKNGNKPPNAAHWLGTDNLGRDILLRVMLAGQVSLLVGPVAMAISRDAGQLDGRACRLLSRMGRYSYYASCRHYDVDSKLAIADYSRRDLVRYEGSAGAADISRHVFARIYGMAELIPSRARANLDAARTRVYAGG